jgi:hypothetical protein
MKPMMRSESGSAAIKPVVCDPDKSLPTRLKKDTRFLAETWCLYAVDLIIEQQYHQRSYPS